MHVIGGVRHFVYQSYMIRDYYTVKLIYNITAVHRKLTLTISNIGEPVFVGHLAKFHGEWLVYTSDHSSLNVL